ncbi:MAG: 50S ribosomal protein L17 [Candidatus Kaelpia aquatica]|nr:50S ribosomal protein L17 [Candidatus Kaelpia aquatica]
MRHRKKIILLSKPADQRRALIKSLAISLIINESIKTTYKRAKAASRHIDKLITLGKRGDIHSRREVYKLLQDRSLVKKLFDDIAPRFKDVQGGYTRVLKADNRRGDNALMAILELTKIKEEVIEDKKKARRLRKEKKAKRIEEDLSSDVGEVEVEEEKAIKKPKTEKDDKKKEKKQIDEGSKDKEVKQDDKEKGFFQGLKGFLKAKKEK